MAQLSKEDLEHFVQPSPEKVENLGAGCFVRVHKNGSCCWAEIDTRNGDGFSGTVHKELSTPGCRSGLKPGARIEFKEGEIVLLGCDNYCWC